LPTQPEEKPRKPGSKPGTKRKPPHTPGSTATPDAKQSERELQEMPNFGGGAK
jgi:hypothetical protein